LRGLELTAKAFPKIDSDDRLKPMLNALSKQYLGQDYGVKSGAVMGQVKHNEIDGVSIFCFAGITHIFSLLRCLRLVCAICMVS
jgi:hypothetical protein